MRIIAVDTCRPGRHHGEVDGSTLSWLERTLLADREKPTLVLMHHPPFACGIPYLDRYRLQDRIRWKTCWAGSTTSKLSFAVMSTG